MVQLSHPYMTTGKIMACIIQIFVSKVMSLLFNMLCRFVLTFLPRSSNLKFHGCSYCSQWFWRPRKKKICHCFPPFLLLFAMKWWDRIPWSLFFECWVLSWLFYSPLSPSSRGSLVPLYTLPLEWYHLPIWGCYFSQQSLFSLWLIEPSIWHDVICI